MSFDVETTAIEPQNTATIRDRYDRTAMDNARAKLIPEVYEELQRAGVEPSGPPFARFHDMGGNSVEVEVGFPISGDFSPAGRVGPSELPGGRVAQAVHAGAFDDAGEAMGRIASWAKKYGHSLGDGPWEVYVTDPKDVPDRESWRTRVVWPLMEE